MTEDEIQTVLDGITASLAETRERVVVIEVHIDHNRDTLNDHDERITWIFRSLWAIMVSLLLIMAGALITVVLAL